MRITKSVCCVLLAGLVLSACKTAGKPIKRLSTEALMYAMIYDYENNPVSGVEVYINGKKIVDSDIQGRFILEKAKKGEYKIRLIKSGYENFEDTFQYDPLQVLYFKMINAGQLLTLAENALDNSKYDSAENYLNRALLIHPNRPDLLFLKSITYYLQTRYSEAADVLENLINSGSTDPSVQRLLKEIRQVTSEKG